MTIQHQVGEGDFVASRYIARGTHDGEYLGIPATGRPVTVHRPLHDPLPRRADRGGMGGLRRAPLLSGWARSPSPRAIDRVMSPAAR